MLHFEERNSDNCGQEERQRMTEFLRDTFVTDGNHNYPAEGLQVARGDQKIAFEFGPSVAVVRVSQGAYTTFAASILPEVYKLRRFVYDVLGLPRVRRIDVRKISVFPIMIEGEPPTEENVGEHLSMVLSDNVLSLMTMDHIPGPDGTVGSFTRSMMEDRETGLRYTILTGLVKDQERENIYNVILDATCFYMPANGIAQIGLEEMLTKMNQNVYELYHWAVRDHVIEFMDRDLSDAGQQGV